MIILFEIYLKAKINQHQKHEKVIHGKRKHLWSTIIVQSGKEGRGGAGGGGVPFHFQQRPVDPVDCGRRELSPKRWSFFLEVFSESFKMVYKGGIQIQEQRLSS